MRRPTGAAGRGQNQVTRSMFSKKQVVRRELSIAILLLPHQCACVGVLPCHIGGAYVPRLSRARHHSSPRVSLARSGTHNRSCSDAYGLIRLREQTHWLQDVGLTLWPSKVSRTMGRTFGQLTFAMVRKWRLWQDLPNGHCEKTSVMTSPCKRSTRITS